MLLLICRYYRRRHTVIGFEADAGTTKLLTYGGRKYERITLR